MYIFESNIQKGGAMPYSCTLPVTIGDINYGQHMGNDRFLAFFHEARLGFLASLGCSESDIGEGLGLIMASAAIIYIAQVKHGDSLVISVTPGECAKASFELLYTAKLAGNNAIAAKGSTKLCAFDYARQKIARLPESFLNKIESARSNA